MSYEGYIQAICAKGHRFDRACYSPNVCDCGEPAVWENGVDQTNGPSEGYIPPEEFEKFKLTDAVFGQCASCGHRVFEAAATYRLPTTEEWQQMRRRLVHSGGEWIVLKLDESSPEEMSWMGPNCDLP